MSKLTDKQKHFIQAMIGGVPQTQAAINAGYAPSSAAVTASQLMKRPDIKAAIRAGGGTTTAKKVTKPSAEVDSMKRKFGSSLELMQATYNDVDMPFGIRFEAAKQALPYEHGKIGEKGKKEAKKDAAQAVVSGRNKFGTKKPPNLTVVR